MTLVAYNHYTKAIPRTKNSNHVRRDKESAREVVFNCRRFLWYLHEIAIILAFARQTETWFFRNQTHVCHGV